MAILLSPGSIPWTDGSAPDSALSLVTFKMIKKNRFFFSKFYAYSFLIVHLNHSSKIKSHKKSQNNRNQGFF
jgi:hypothetical protein